MVSPQKQIRKEYISGGTGGEEIIMKKKKRAAFWTKP